jgi:hypothetical protein
VTGKWGLTFLTVWTSLACTLSAAAQATAGGTAKPTAEQVGIGVMAGMTANMFRLHAAVDVDAAVAKWGNEAFRQKWEAEVNALFSRPERFELHDFFSSAVVWVGGCKGAQSVTGFYSPWVDGLLVLAMDQTAEKMPVLTDFAFISGESLRGVEDLSPEQALALYDLKEPLIVAVSRYYAPSAELFSALYPPTGEPVLLPAALKARVDSQAGELMLLKARMIVRMKMFRDYLDKANHGWMVQSGVLMHALKAGDKEKLMAFLSERQPAALVESVCQLDPSIRKDFGPVYFARASEGVIVGYVNPSAPRWLLEATFQGKKPAPRSARIELLDLELGDQVLKLWKKEVPK